MEITTSPHRPTATPWSRLLVLVVILGPVTALVLLPIGLGLQRYVVSGHSMAGGIDRGSVVFERVVPVSDLRVGDVITYRPPASTGIEGRVTHRIVDIDPAGITTKGDANARPDPWRLEPEGPTLPRVAFTVPWVGYAYLVALQPHAQLAIFAVAFLAAVLLHGGLARRRRGSGPGHPAGDAP